MGQWFVYVFDDYCEGVVVLYGEVVVVYLFGVFWVMFLGFEVVYGVDLLWYQVDMGEYWYVMVYQEVYGFFYFFIVFQFYCLGVVVGQQVCGVVECLLG